MNAPFYADFDVRAPVNGCAPGVAAFFWTETHERLCEAEGDFYDIGFHERAADAVARAAPDVKNARDIALTQIRRKVENLRAASPVPAAIGTRPKPLASAAARPSPRGCREILDKSDPLPTARLFVEQNYSFTGEPTLVYSGGVFYPWNGTAYAEIEAGALRAQLYPWLEKFHRRVIKRDGDVRIERFKPTKRDVELTTDALKAITYTELRPPAWVRAHTRMPDPAKLIVAPTASSTSPPRHTVR